MAEATALQNLVTFEDVSISFSLDEWEELTGWQKNLYMDVMKDNYESLMSLGLAPQTPAIPGHGDGGEDPPPGKPLATERREGVKHSFMGVGQPEVKQEPGAGQDGAGLPCHRGPPEARNGSRDHRSIWEQLVWSRGLLRPDSAALSPWWTEFKGLDCVAAGEQAVPVKFPLGHQGASGGLGQGSFWPLDVAALQPSPHEVTMLICTRCQKCFPARSSADVPSGAALQEPSQVCLECQGGHTEDTPGPADPPSQAAMPPCACMRSLALNVRPRASKEERPYHCGKCEKRFRYLHECTWHQKVHSGEKTFRCSKCEKVFRHQQELMWHQRTHAAEWPHKCATCEKPFRFKQELTWHLKTHSAERPYKCGECGKSFRYKQEFMWHQRAHVGDRPYKCGECEKSFRFKQEFTWHLRSHAGEKMYKCPGCDKSFRYKQEFIWHQRIHMGEQPYPCASCNSMFTCRQEFMRHQRLHDGEKPYQCPHCEKTFRRGSTLIRHRRIHMGEGTFKCAHCARTFGQSANLLKHQRMHTLRHEPPEAASGWRACLQSSGQPLPPDAISSKLGLKKVSVGALLLLNLPESKGGTETEAKSDSWEPQM